MSDHQSHSYKDHDFQGHNIKDAAAAIMSWPVEVHSGAALREIADAVWDVWTEDVDDDVAAMAREAARVLRRLAERVERG